MFVSLTLPTLITKMLIKQVVECCCYFLVNKLIFESKFDPCSENLSSSVC